MQVDFYQLAAVPIERVLPQICEKVLASGGRLLVVADEPLLSQLDAQLWTYADESFLPHGAASGASPDSQPILLATAVDPLNEARNIALADGRWREEVLGFDRVFYFFDTAGLEDARGTWRALKGREGVESRFWKQVDGKWKQGP